VPTLLPGTQAGARVCRADNLRTHEDVRFSFARALTVLEWRYVCVFLVCTCGGEPLPHGTRKFRGLFDREPRLADVGDPEVLSHKRVDDVVMLLLLQHLVAQDNDDGLFQGLARINCNQLAPTGAANSVALLQRLVSLYFREEHLCLGQRRGVGDRGVERVGGWRDAENCSESKLVFFLRLLRIRVAAHFEPSRLRTD
jgi:hypothetical protein